MAGLGLQNQEFSVTSQHTQNISALSRHNVYFYELPSSIGSSPHPCHWAKMISLHGEQFGVCPPDMKCGGLPTWETWWLKYHSDNVLYTLYPNHQDAFAVDHREVGVHIKKKREVTMRKVSSWQQERELENLPDNPEMLDLLLKINNNLGMHFARQIWTRSGLLILRFIQDQEALRQLRRNIRKIETENHLTIFLVEKEELGERLISMGANYVALYNYEMASYDPAKKDLILMEFSSYGNRIITLPNDVTLSDIELPEVQL